MGYYNQKFLLSFALDDITERGLPVDIERQTKLREYIESEEIRLLAEIQALVPFAVRPLSKAYKGLPKDLRTALKERDLIVKKAGLDYYHINHYDLCNSLNYYLIDDQFVRVEDFNPNSHKQLINYLTYMGYRIPLHIDTGEATTGKEEFAQLIAETDDELLKLTQKIKKLTKLGGTYASGDWIPGEDGCVHGTFRYTTAIGQTAATKPNCQQFPEHFDKKDEWISEIMRQVKGSIRAKEGHKLVKVDARSAHARMQGFLAEDPDYYRLASLDLHSYTTGHYMNVPDAREMILLNDADLHRRLKEINKQYNHIRNSMVKRITYLMQYGGGAEKAATILRVAVAEVEGLISFITQLFPLSFADFPKKIKALVKQHPRLVSPHGHCRWMWDGDLQQAIAFMVANPFHAHIQDAIVRLFQQGVFSRYNVVNFTHDALWLHPLEADVPAAIKAVQVEFERPSEILVNSLGAFWCSADAQVGDSLLDMEDV